MEQISNRKNYIDIAKGIAVISIVFLHYEDGVIPLYVHNWIGLFMITTFYFTSGWLFGMAKNKISVKELVKKRIKSLVLPYIWFTLLILAFDLLWIILGFYDKKVIFVDLYKALILRGIGTLWFLPALFFGEVIFVYLRNKRWYWIIAGIILSAVYIGAYELFAVSSYESFSDHTKIILAPLYVIKCALFAWMVVGAGYFVVRKLWPSEPNAFIVAVCSVCALTAYTALQLIHSGNVAVTALLGLIIPIVGPFAILTTSMLTERLAINKFFIFWGRNSLILMATHYSIVMEICIVINKYILNQPEFTGINTIYFFIISMLVQYPIVWLINKKAAFMIGK